MIVLIYGCEIQLPMCYQMFFYMFLFTDVESKLYNYIADTNLQFLIPTVKLF